VKSNEKPPKCKADKQQRSSTETLQVFAYVQALVRKRLQCGRFTNILGLSKKDTGGWPYFSFTTLEQKLGFFVIAKHELYK